MIGINQGYSSSVVNLGRKSVGDRVVTIYTHIVSYITRNFQEKMHFL